MYTFLVQFWAATTLLSVLAGQPTGAFIDSDGSPRTLWGLSKGRPLVVIVTKGYWCPACMAQLAVLDINKISRLGALVVVVNNDDPHMNAEVQKQLDLRFPLLSDPKGRWLKKRKLWVDSKEHPLPAILFYDQCGDLVYERKGRQPGEPDDGLIFEVLKHIRQTKRDCPNFTYNLSPKTKHRLLNNNRLLAAR